MNTIKVGIIGIGYVGLPLALAFSAKYKTIAYDVDTQRVHDLLKNQDTALENSTATIRVAQENGLVFTADKKELAKANFYIITVPTPVDKDNKPDLSQLLQATKTVAQFLQKGDIVVYESTVYPSVTETICAPLLAKKAGLGYNKDFFVGYSPERFNPGDSEHTVTNTLKITSGSTPEIAQKITAIYDTIITAGTYLAPSIQVAEAAKILENAQRDINIAFINEMAQLFAAMDIDTNAVLAAAGTKWNFMPFTPGLVGGHCIGVDSYYLLHRAKELAYEANILQAGRLVNNSMSSFVAQQLVKQLLAKDIAIKNAKVLLAGITIKENVTDIRNSKSVALLKELTSYQMQVAVYDPWADAAEVKKVYAIDLLTELTTSYDAIIIAVGHNEFKKMDFAKHLIKQGVLYDMKGVLDKKA